MYAFLRFLFKIFKTFLAKVLQNEIALRAFYYSQLHPRRKRGRGQSEVV